MRQHIRLTNNLDSDSLDGVVDGVFIRINILFTVSVCWTNQSMVMRMTSNLVCYFCTAAS